MTVNFNYSKLQFGPRHSHYHRHHLHHHHHQLQQQQQQQLTRGKLREKSYDSELANLKQYHSSKSSAITTGLALHICARRLHRMLGSGSLRSARCDMFWEHYSISLWMSAKECGRDERVGVRGSIRVALNETGLASCADAFEPPVMRAAVVREEEGFAVYICDYHLHIHHHHHHDHH